ncbi:MAG TPA: XrtA system polysaccharide deacetylase [Rhizomicrobium sp.]|jgi:polysaccharide deacetylase family protein (PEP-CTERM system associated)
MIHLRSAEAQGELCNANSKSRTPITNALSVDVEDYFQVEAFKAIIDRSMWDSQPSRVVANTIRVLELFSAANVKATFFVLGWVAMRFPDMVRRIAREGHEIASHGFSHELAHSQSPAAFREDVQRAKALLEDISGGAVRGFRAPTFSIGPGNWWAYEILAEMGYKYSSSVYPISHDLYGSPDAQRIPFLPVVGSNFLEIPIGTIRLFNKNRPCGGGGYFRLLPYEVSRWCIRRLNLVERMPCVFYCHPWEFDPGQPRQSQAPLKSRIRHYLNIGKMEHRTARLLHDFSWGRIDEVYFSNPLVGLVEKSD